MGPLPQPEPTTEATTNSEKKLFQRIDIPSLASSIIIGFLALGTEPWWTLKGATSDQILNVEVSPFYVLITGAGLPTTLPSSFLIGALTRVLLAAASLLLGISAFLPKAWWRKLSIWFSLSSLTTAYLGFTLLLHATRIALLSAYGAEPPVLGTATLPGIILGIDLAIYASPTVTAAFTLPFYLGLSSAIIAGLGRILEWVRNPPKVFITSELTRGVKEAHLTPPYQYVWLSTTDQDLNPLLRDPERLSDDELATSFEKLNSTLQPGGTLSMVIPAWSVGLSRRLLRLVPWTGLQLERADVIYRAAGKPEHELVFRKPIVQRQAESQPETAERWSSLVEELVSGPAEHSAPPLTDLDAEPTWSQPEMTRLERAMLTSAVAVVTMHKEPVPYRELLNEVYMDLLDRKIDFQSVRQIENTLLNHAGKELVIMEVADETGNSIVRKWWLGDIAIEKDQGEPSRQRTLIPKIPGLFRLLKIPRRAKQSGYRQKRQTDEG